MKRDLSLLRHHLLKILKAAIAEADASSLVERALASQDIHKILKRGPLTVVGAGKASAVMVAAFLKSFVDRPVDGIVAGTHLSGDLPLGVKWYLAGHPLPTEQSLIAGSEALSVAKAAHPEGHLVVLLTGGASALLSVPTIGLTLDDKIQATQVLLSAGVEIDALNCVRKHLSAVKGGWLAAVAPCPVLTIAISDVVGPIEDDPTVIGSGPTVADPTTFKEAIEIINRPMVRRLFPSAARAILEKGMRGNLPETPKPEDPRLNGSEVRIIGGRKDALKGAQRTAQTLGYAVEKIDVALTGEARVVGQSHAQRIIEMARSLPRPVCILSSGETTVQVKGHGRGGRNQEFALASVSGLRALGESVVMASVGTDGVDGPTDAAGAIVDSTTMDRARGQNLRDPRSYLDDNNAYVYFESLGDLIKTGPTNTNVGDIQIALLD